MVVAFRLIIKKHYLSLIILPMISVGIYLTSLYSFILFHIVAESFSIVIAVCLFMIAWNTRHLTKNIYLLFISIAFLFAGFIDFVHTMAYKGMGIFIGYDANLPTQLWIIARYLQSISLLVAPWFIDRKLRTSAIFGFYVSATILLLAAVFSGTFFPDCFIEGKGLTTFKIASEYIICFILICSFILLYRRRDKFDPKILRLITWSILCTIVSEIVFTFYISVYGLSNLIGHFFKIFSFYFIYRAIIVIGLVEPYSLLFYDLQKKQEELGESEERYRSLVENANEAILVIQDGMIKFFNNKALEATGYSRQEYMSIPFLELIHPEDRDLVIQRYMQKINGDNTPTRQIYRTIPKSGQTQWIEISSVLIDWEGRPATLNLITDITERKHAENKLRESEERFRLVQDNSPDGFTILKPVRDDLGRVVDFTWIYENDTIARLNGTKPKEVVGRSLLELFPGHSDSQFLKEYTQVAETGQSCEFEECYLGETITERTWFRIVVVPTAENIAILAQNITERKRVESQREALLEEIHKLNETLEQRINEKTSELKENIVLLERTNKVFVGRELRIRELKEQIAEMEKKGK